MKFKKGVRAPVALEADLNAVDIDICVISETHLNRDIPDSAVSLHNYSIYRQDRDYGGTDLRKKGGVAIYIRNNLIITDVTRSERFECISLVIDLPSRNRKC